MDISKIISLDTVKNKISCASKKKLFELISGLASARLDVPADELLDALFQREKLGTTYCGKGVAIPHGTFESDKNGSPAGVFLTFDRPFEFGGPGQMANVVFAYFSPKKKDQSDSAEELKEIAGRILDNEFLKAIQKPDTDQDLYNIIKSQFGEGSSAESPAAES